MTLLYLDYEIFLIFSELTIYAPLLSRILNEQHNTLNTILFVEHQIYFTKY